MTTAVFALLNCKGKAMLGAVFPDGRVPLLSSTPERVLVRGSVLAMPLDVYLVRVGDLTDEQVRAIAVVIYRRAEKRVKQKEIREFITKHFLHLGGNLVRGVLNFEALEDEKVTGDSNGK